MPVITITEPEVQVEEESKILPPYVVIVYNDNDHTFDYVIETFQRVFGYSLEKCFKLAETIHKCGKAVVWSGQKEIAELKQEQLMTAGPDRYAQRAGKKVEYPLRVEIEPLR